MAEYTLTFDPELGGTLTLTEGSDWREFSIICEDGIALNSNYTWSLRDVDNGVSVSVSQFGPNSDNTAIVGHLSSAITTPGTYYLAYSNRGSWITTIPAGTFLLGPENAQVESEEMEYYFTVVIFDGLTIPLTDLDGYVTGSAYVTPAEGTGDGVVSFTADECEGLDREGVATWTANGCADVERKVFQLGLREKFTDDDFMVADGGTFHVLKEEKVLNNYYEFVGSDEGDSVVTIDGVNVTVPAGATVKGYFADDISSIPTNNLKKIKIIGDVSTYWGMGQASNYNYTVEEIELQFSKNYNFSTWLCMGLKALTKVVLRGGKPTSLLRLINQDEVLMSATIHDVDSSECTSLYYFMNSCAVLESIDLSCLDTSKVETMYGFAWQARCIREINLGDKWDMGKVTNVANMFLNCTSLANVTGTISNLKLSFDLSSSPLTRESALVFINGLSSEVSGQTLTLSSTTKALLTDEDIAIATDKGWTIA